MHTDIISVTMRERASLELNTNLYSWCKVPWTQRARGMLWEVQTAEANWRGCGGIVDEDRALIGFHYNAGAESINAVYTG